jgi:tRNA(Ile)-lysidine synthase
MRLRRLGTQVDAGIVVGFSGGADSLALAAVLARIAGVEPISVTLVHVDHALRPESGRDAEACRELARALGLPIVVAKLPRELRQWHAHVGVEEAARRERYVALADAAASVGASLVAVAHHLQDQAETVLLHLLRGAGLTGASAMAEHSQTAIPWWRADPSVPVRTIDVWRPFLNEDRHTVRSYAAATGLTPVEDASNDDRAFRRNRVRAEVLPLLEDLFPGAARALARYAEIAGDEDRLLIAFAADAGTRTILDDGRLDRRALSREHPAMQRRVIRRWLRDGGVPTEVSLDRIDSLRAMSLDAGGKRTVEMVDGWTVVVDGVAAEIGRPIAGTSDRH